MTQQDAYRLIQRHARHAAIKTRIGNHSMRATGITDYLKNDGSLAEARKMANHADTQRGARLNPVAVRQRPFCAYQTLNTPNLPY
jgi:hypothetical protein